MHRKLGTTMAIVLHSFSSVHFSVHWGCVPAQCLRLHVVGSPTPQLPERPLRPRSTKTLSYETILRIRWKQVTMIKLWNHSFLWRSAWWDNSNNPCHVFLSSLEQLQLSLDQNPGDDDICSLNTVLASWCGFWSISLPGTACPQLWHMSSWCRTLGKSVRFVRRTPHA